MNSTDVIKEYFAGYGAAVAQSRALVSVEDGLKPSMRMAMYANYTDKWVAPKKTGKFVKIVGSASRFCWHGDASTYGMLIRAAKPFAMRYPLYDAQGSYGTLMDADSHAAPRYVEGRISPIGALLFNKIDEETIFDWRDNYDNTEQYPGILPSIGFWNLCNGTSGIGTGLASSIPQFNLREMNMALIEMLNDRDFDLPLPDFATGGILLNASEVRESLEKGSGNSCKIRARITYDDSRRAFKVTEMPYATYTNTVCKELEALMEDEESGIDSFNDATGVNPDIEIYLSKKAKPEEVLTLLYQKTSLQNTYAINLTMLENGRVPKVYTLREAMQAHLNHEIEIYRNSYLYQLRKAKARVHILDGYILACAQINEVIKVIREAANKEHAARGLVQNFALDRIQADAILKLTLGRLAHLEVQKFEEERADLLEHIAQLEAILSDETLLKKKVEEGLRTVAQNFGDARRTQILDIVQSEKEKLLYFTAHGKVSLAPSKTENTIASIPYGYPYLCVTKKGAIYRTSDVPKRAKQVFKIDEDDYIIAVYVDDPAKFLTFVDVQKHFRCKEISSLNKTKTTLNLEPLTFVACTSERTTKANYREICKAEN